VKGQFEREKAGQMDGIEDPSELSEEERASLAGQAVERIFARMNELDTSFKERLGEPLTDWDRGRAVMDMNTTLANEIVRLWDAFEQLAHRLGVEVRVEEQPD
jgi:hypothetical protein